MFTIKQQELPYCKLMVAVWHRRKLGKDVHIGTLCVLGGCIEHVT